MNLSKSKYVRGLQCPKQLWLDKYKPEEYRVDESTQSAFNTGNIVGDLARKYFGKCTLVDFDKGIDSMLKETQDFINSGEVNIAEASFFVDGLFCSVDILHKTPYGWDIVEVKSATEIHDVYLDDMAFQYYVLTKAGLKISGVYNMHINNQYVRHGELDLKQLFTIEDCTEICLFKQADIEQNIDDIRKYIADAGDTEPVKDIDMCCESPYKCAYYGYCSRHLPTPSVFDISRLKISKKYEYYHSGIVSFEDVFMKAPKLSDKQWMQVDAEYKNSPPYIDKLGIKSCIKQYIYPIYYLDFETYQTAVPQFDNVKPYMQIPFQYSLHIQYEKGGELEHREFLGNPTEDPRRALCEQMCKDIPKDVCVLVYNMAFEKTRIREMAEIFPDLADHLMNIHDNIKDLMIPFQQKYYYSKELQGSYSIKYVLPTLCPDDPELDYHNLDGIHNGGEAMNAYPDLVNHTPEEQAVIRKNLLAYCRLDTLAMVKVLEKLYDMCGY